MIEATAAREATQSARPLEAAQPGSIDYTPAANGGGTLGFWDMLDVINPLQHIPIVSTVYRKLTGDEISPLARIAGATLFGGPIGAAFALVDTAVEHKTGRDMGGNVMAALFPDDKLDAATEIAARPPGTPAAVHGFVPRAGDPIQLMPAAAASASHVAPRAPDLQSLAGFETAAGARAFGDPVKLEPRHAVDAGGEQVYEGARSHPKRVWTPPPADLPKGAAATLARRATRAYVASAGVAPAEPAAAPHASKIADTGTAVRKVELVTEEGRDDWIVQAMMSALDKYGETSRRNQTSGAPAQAVWR